MRLPIHSLLLSLVVSLAACEVVDDEPKTTDTDPDAVVLDTDVVVDTDVGPDTDVDTDTTPSGQYLDPETAPLPDPADFDYSASVTFALTDVVGGFDGTTVADAADILCDEATCPDAFEAAPGNNLYAIDSDFGSWVADFQGGFGESRDGDYDDGFIGELTDPQGVVHGITVGSVETAAYQVGYPRGSWCGGLGETLVKCSSEHFVAMEHVLTCFETIPYMSYDAITGEPNNPLYEDLCETLDEIPSEDIAALSPYAGDLVDMLSSQDYAITLKDDGKYLYRWGTWEKNPTDVRLITTIALPAEWKTDTVYRVTRAELAVVHTISNSPNDQLRAEDLENEAATGRKPRYQVEADGSWTSTVDCYESDGHFLPAGTVLKNPAWAIPGAGSSDLSTGYTNAWYTTLDRDPFEADPVSGAGPRWRLKSPKFGQDIPGVEISTDACAPPPTKKEFIKYPAGELTTTVIDLLDWRAGEDSPLLYSTGWMEPTIQEMREDRPDVTVNGARLTDDFDLSYYVKGEYKTTNLYKAVLYLDYEPID